MQASVDKDGTMFVASDKDDRPGAYSIKVSASLNATTGKLSYSVSEPVLVKIHRWRWLWYRIREHLRANLQAIRDDTFWGVR